MKRKNLNVVQVKGKIPLSILDIPKEEKIDLKETKKKSKKANK